MGEIEKINVEIIKPRYAIGKRIYVPQRSESGTTIVTGTTISGYAARVGEKQGTLFGVVTGYDIPTWVSIRRGEEAVVTSEVRDGDFYPSKTQATHASCFLEVRVNEETWKLAIGDRKVEDDTSPYSLANSGLGVCCANISEARDILSYCRGNSGLMVHNRDELSSLLTIHEPLQYR